MPSFEETLARMKGLYTYGKEMNESKNVSSHTLECHTIAANGKAYGIIRECNKYYIKTAPKDKEMVAEAYDYIGGIANKKDYEYDSYANASRHFELKVNSINESCDAEPTFSTLDPFKKNIVLAESTQQFAGELARQRQIMYNAARILNEATEIGADRKDDVVMYDGKNPEAETGVKGDRAEGSKDGKAVLDKDFPKKTNGVDKKASPFDQNAIECTDQLKEECDCDCSCKGNSPKTVGWEMKGADSSEEEECVCPKCGKKGCVCGEDDCDSQCHSSESGVGEADTAHNNSPFTKTVSESEEKDSLDATDVEGDEDFDFGDEDESSDDLDDDMADEFGGEDLDDDTADEGDLDAEDDVEDDDEDEEDAIEIASDDIEDEDEEKEGLMAQIEELQSQIDALKAQIDSDKEDSEDVEADDEYSEDDFDDDSDSEDDFDATDDEITDGEKDFKSDFDDVDDDEYEDDGEFDDEMDECGSVECGMSPVNPNAMNEGKQKKMNRIVESVVNKILAETELHDFGKHPGYRKKPMELPATGEDKNQWGRDWNDNSVHNEEPFGERIGEGAPFTELVDLITKNVMSQLADEASKSDKKKEK